MLWILICFFLIVYLYLTTNSLFELIIGISIMVIVICFLNDWNIEQMAQYLKEELSPIINFFENKFIRDI